jgi:hypothetical protein
VRFPFKRLPILLLALMPVVWGNCPYWFVGAPGSSAKAGGATRTASTCPCCRQKAPAPVSRGPVDPFDCGDCPMLVARHGSAPAPTPVTVPTADDGGTFFAAVALPVAFDVLAAASIRAAAGPPAGPPGSVVSRLLDEVSLRI